ncbi:sensor histidine kinase [Pseudonocardia nigra]|uniref:sensor histidine kinase n=1 Tax=Pseudonocardia nigra TaxID=1921578 RepID=UPI001C5E37D5|nr:histidine kinase [Pseudonocardia nigra]
MTRADHAARPTRRRGAAMLRDRWSLVRQQWHLSSLWTAIWLSALIYVPLLDPTSGPLQYVVGVAVIAVFVPFSLLVEAEGGVLARRAPAITTVLAVLATPLNAGANILLVYAAGLAGSALSRRAVLRWQAGLTLLLLGMALVSHIEMPWRLFTFGPSLVLIWIIGFIAHEQAAHARATRFRNAQVEHLATLSDRERIARDLHDLLGQTLTGIVVRSQLAQRLARSDAEAGIAEMAQVERAARAALAEVRETVSGWRQVDIDDELGVAGDALAAAGVELSVAREPELVFTPSAETALGLALREAVTNVVRHAHASRCTVALRQVDGRVVLEVADDGVGGDAPEGNGMIGMRERIAAIGGEVQRRTREGRAVTVVVPSAVAT